MQSVSAQSGSPVPGSGTLPSTSTEPQATAPLPGSDNNNGGFTTATPAPTGKYAQLPLSILDAKSRLLELRSMASIAKPQEVLEAVNRLYEWLTDICDAHNRMAIVFAKHDQMKAQAQAERQAVQKFVQVRNQTQLLKAELLMQQNRFPEALAPLVDIVIAEPTSATGLTAYAKLKEMGFAQEPEPTPLPSSSSPPSPSSAPAPTLSIEGTTLQVKKVPAGSVEKIKHQGATPHLSTASSTQAKRVR